MQTADKLDPWVRELLLSEGALGQIWKIQWTRRTTVLAESLGLVTQSRISMNALELTARGERARLALTA